MAPTSYDYGIGPGKAHPGEPYWLEKIKHQGNAAFNPDSSYQVFRNVKDFGAVGDGKTDDTAAIDRAMSTGDRCGRGDRESTTIAPAVVYFPSGIYLVSKPIVAYYYSQIVGDARNPPTILASPSFAGLAIIDADPYIPDGWGRQWYTNQNNFFRGVRNIIIDLRQMPSHEKATGLHWQVSQATSLQNLCVHMSTTPGNQHQGMFMENGSGGFMGDLVFNGGKYGMWLGNQQFTVRNVTVNNAETGIWAQWNWGWTFQSIIFNDCKVGFDLVTGGLTIQNQTVGAEAILDAHATNVPIFLRTSQPSKSSLAGSLVLHNVSLVNCPVAVGVAGGKVVLSGGTTTIETWGQGNVYAGNEKEATFVQGPLPGRKKASLLLDGEGKVFGRGRPQYEDYSVEQVVSVKSEGAKGDGVTDDTAAIRAVLHKHAANRIIFFDHGTYLITDTIKVPKHARLVGEVWSVIMGGGERFANQAHPHVMVQVGEEHDEGIVEITDLIFATRGSAAGAIVVQWNIRDPPGIQGGSGMWDSHIRLGGAAGTNLEAPACVKGTCSDACYAAFMALHLTRNSTAYLEGTWVWLADHWLDGDGKSQLTLFSGRGMLSESQGPVWMVGTAEHHVLYQYMLKGARNHFMGLIQTESPYFQPTPAAPAPFQVDKRFHDPDTEEPMAWGLWVENSHDIIVFGAGLYAFFSSYSQRELDTSCCQSHLLNIDDASSVDIYSLSTVGARWMLSVRGEGIVHQSKNRNGFAATATCWTRSLGDMQLVSPKMKNKGKVLRALSGYFKPAKPA